MNRPPLISQEAMPSLPARFFDYVTQPAGDENPAFYVFSLHKCASTMQQRIFRQIATANGMGSVEIDRFCFEYDATFDEAGLEDIKRVLATDGYYHGVFRRFGLDRHPDFCPFPVSERKSILIVRNPLDILTSYYFSSIFSHIAPGVRKGVKKSQADHQNIDTTQSIDDFVWGPAAWFKQTFGTYAPLYDNPLCRIFRYEDIIFDLEGFIRAASDHVGLSVEPDLMASLVEAEDRRPSSEDKFAHVRQVTPGDHARKMKPETIERLKEIFQTELDRFGY